MLVKTDAQWLMLAVFGGGDLWDLLVAYSSEISHEKYRKDIVRRKARKMVSDNKNRFHDIWLDFLVTVKQTHEMMQFCFQKV